jgi:hypothetical protein
MKLSNAVKELGIFPTKNLISDTSGQVEPLTDMP